MARTRAPRRRRSSLQFTLNHRGIAFVHSRPYHPQTCGKVERFHQTEKNWLTRQPRANTLAQLQFSTSPSQIVAGRPTKFWEVG